MPVKNKNKMKKLILLSVFAFAAVFACGQAVAATITGKTFINANYTGVKTIKVSQTVLDVNIVKSSGSKTGVKCYVEKMIVNDSDYAVKARLVGSTLEIYQEPKNNLSFRETKGYINISAAPGVNVIIVNSVSGDASVKGMDLDNLSLSTVSGDISVGQVSASDVSLKSVSGDISVERTVASTIMSVTTTSGDVDAGNSRGGKIDVASVSGDVKASNIDFSLAKCSTTSGDVYASMAGSIKEVAASSVSGDIKLYFKGNIRDNNYTLSGVSSDIVIAGYAKAKKKFVLEGNSGVSVKANAVSGDIYIGNY